MIEAFRIDVPQAALDDLRDCLGHTRWTADFADEGWDYGANAANVRELAGHWRDRFGWRVREAMMDAFPQFCTTIDGFPVHFIHLRGKGAAGGPSLMPLILNHVEGECNGRCH